MLTLNVNRRPTAEHAMKHPFFTCAMKTEHLTQDKSTEYEHALRVWCNELSLPHSTYTSHRVKKTAHV